jgi:Ras-related protein Rab-1A
MLIKKILFLKMDAGEEIYRIITLGDSGVGKTSIMKRYVHNIFQEDCISTVGVGFSFKEAIVEDGTKIKLKLIDTAGQEKYKAIAKSYYRNAEGVLFVFSYDNKESFNHIEDWLNFFKDNRKSGDKDNGQDIPIVLIGNKYDVENRVINDEKINDLKNRIGIEDFAKTSAKDNIGIEEDFKNLSQKIYNINIKKKGKKQKKTKLMNEKSINKDRLRNKCTLCQADTYSS